VPLFHTPPDHLFPGFAVEFTQRLHRSHPRIKARLASQALLCLFCPDDPQRFLTAGVFPLQQAQFVPFLNGGLIDLQAGCCLRSGQVACKC
jgi:hypothetical protein